MSETTIPSPITLERLIRLFDDPAVKVRNQPLLEYMHATAFHLVKNVHDADDLLQHVALHLMTTAQRHPERLVPNLPAFLKRVTYNLFVDGYRRRKIFVPLHSWKDCEEVFIDIPVKQESIIETVINNELREQLMNALGGWSLATPRFLEIFEGVPVSEMPAEIKRVRRRLQRIRPEQQEAFFAFVHGQTYNDIALQQNVLPSTAMSRVGRARRGIEESMDRRRAGRAMNEIVCHRHYKLTEKVMHTLPPA